MGIIIRRGRSFSYIGILPMEVASVHPDACETQLTQLPMVLSSNSTDRRFGFIWKAESAHRAYEENRLSYKSKIADMF